MEYWIIAFTALFASGLTFFSGFGLGTILLPVFSLFFPIEIAIILTAIVHFLNNIFKIVLVGRNIKWQTAILFGTPAILFAYLGAKVLQTISVNNELVFNIFHLKIETNWLNIIIGSLLFFFALIDIIPSLKNLNFSKKWLPIGGILSGFFGGLSGHQGVLRSAFLIRSNLTKEAFIATGIFIACLIDISRLSVYSSSFLKYSNVINYNLVLIATFSAFLGAYIGNKIVKKITLDYLHKTVAFLIMLFSVLMILGWV